MSERDENAAKVTGPLKGLRIVEFAGLGPVPFACMLLSDMGAEVVQIDRPGGRAPHPAQVTQRGRTRMLIDLKDAEAVASVLDLLESADVLVEGFRPGVMERLGLGPGPVMQRNPRLVYARMTGWGQDGPLATSAGHDINYIALTGALHAIGPAGKPVAPLNLLGDYGGGSMFLLVGILAALHHARESGQGQVVDAAISDGVINLMALFIGQAQQGMFVERREANLLDGGRPWYGVYETADGEHLAVGPLEPQFFREFCDRVGVPAALQDAQADSARWPALRDALAGIFSQGTLAQWRARLEGTDACVTPVLGLQEAICHPHNVAREAFTEHQGIIHPAPAPRFMTTPSAIQCNGPELTDVRVLARAWRASA